jgi:ribokinase
MGVAVMGMVVVLGCLTVDFLVRAPRMPSPGETLIGDQFVTSPGGKGFNQGVAAARLGAEVVFVGSLGMDAFGDASLRVFREEGIGVEHVYRHPTLGTGVASIVVDARTGQNAIVAVQRANSGVPIDQVVSAIESVAAKQATSGIPATFLCQWETNQDSITAGLRTARASGLRTIFNCAPVPTQPCDQAVFEAVDILIANETEATTLTGVAVEGPETARQAAERLLEYGVVGHVIVTLGSKGFIWSTRDDKGPDAIHKLRPAFEVETVDPTGAGDAFCGSLAAKLAEGVEMEEALRWANAAGGFAVGRMGALPSLATPAQVKAMLATPRLRE